MADGATWAGAAEQARSEMMHRVPANDNARRGLSLEFIGVPKLFCDVYSRELLDWAASFHKAGQFLDVRLWSAPDANVLSAGWQGEARLRCDAMAAPETGHVVMVIQPDGEENTARVRRHCEVLPSIMAAHRAKAEASRGTARGAVRAVFSEKIPEYFVKRYGGELRAWGQNLKAIGLVKTIVLREGTLSDLSPDPEQGAVLLGVKLQATIERLHNNDLELHIAPASEMDARTIANHVQKMQAVGIDPIANLVEPPRPGLPMLPDIIGAPPPPEDGGV